MHLDLSWSTVTGQGSENGDDMSRIAAQWRPGVEVRISHPAKRMNGPVRVLATPEALVAPPVREELAPAELGTEHAATFS